MDKQLKSIDSIKFDNGKYEIRIIDNGLSVELYRHKKLWAKNPPYSRMFIPIVYEVNGLLEAAERLIKQLPLNSHTNMTTYAAVIIDLKKVISEARGNNE